MHRKKTKIIFFNLTGGVKKDFCSRLADVRVPAKSQNGVKHSGSKFNDEKKTKTPLKLVRSEHGTTWAERTRNLGKHGRALPDFCSAVNSAAKAADGLDQLPLGRPTARFLRLGASVRLPEPRVRTT